VVGSGVELVVMKGVSLTDLASDGLDVVQEFIFKTELFVGKFGQRAFVRFSGHSHRAASPETKNNNDRRDCGESDNSATGDKFHIGILFGVGWIRQRNYIVLIIAQLLLRVEPMAW
jgi:hypothetical protein